MFINFSNHPSEKWTKEQLEAAREYGEVKDIAFPVVPADADEDLVTEMVDACVRLIKEIAKPVKKAAEEQDSAKETAVMVQGEFTLTYGIVRKLKRLGYYVVSACSERNTTEQVDENGNTVKVTKFSFTRFREYR